MFAIGLVIFYQHLDLLLSSNLAIPAGPCIVDVYDIMGYLLNYVPRHLAS